MPSVDKHVSWSVISSKGPPRDRGGRGKTLASHCWHPLPALSKLYSTEPSDTRCTSMISIATRQLLQMEAPHIRCVKKPGLNTGKARLKGNLNGNWYSSWHSSSQSKRKIKRDDHTMLVMTRTENLWNRIASRPSFHPQPRSTAVLSIDWLNVKQITRTGRMPGPNLDNSISEQTHQSKEIHDGSGCKKEIQADDRITNWKQWPYKVRKLKVDGNWSQIIYFCADVTIQSPGLILVIHYSTPWTLQNRGFPWGRSLSPAVRSAKSRYSHVRQCDRMMILNGW